MRHLIDTYVEADEPRKISPFDGMGLLELIVKSGITDAIASQLGGLKGNKSAIAETIENNVRRTIHPPTGRVRISAPRRMSIDRIRVFAISNLDWIK